jgi:hypothetical protein
MFWLVRTRKSILLPAVKSVDRAFSADRAKKVRAEVRTDLWLWWLRTNGANRKRQASKAGELRQC